VRRGDRSAVIPPRELVERFSIPPEALEEHLSLLNLVNFGGGCYAVYAELHGDEVHVDKELFGDTFRRAPRLTPLEARAIRLALEFVGPMIAAGAQLAARSRARQARGDIRRVRPRPDSDLSRPAPRRISSRRSPGQSTEQRVVELEYLKPESTRSRRARSSRIRSSAACLTGMSTPGIVDRDEPRSYRLDRMRTAKRLRRGFKRREGFEPAELHHATSARIWYSPEVARWEIEKGARPLVDGAAISERAVGSVDWLVGEVLSFRGDAIVLEPHDLRASVALRARELERTLRRAPAKTSL
jgi:hypothetical protein